MRKRFVRQSRRLPLRRGAQFALLVVGAITVLALALLSLCNHLLDSYVPEKIRGLPMGRVGGPLTSAEPVRPEEYAQRPPGSHAQALSRIDRLDPLSPRPGERFITFDAFLDCLAARLRVDRHQQRELPIRSDEPHFPYMVAPITFELRELKAFTCNVTVPIKHFMIVVNYNLNSVTEFIDATAAAFAFTQRLRIPHFPRNRGYAGALNEAMRDALTFPFDEVPFFFMSNYDVRLEPGLLEEALPRIRTSAFAGKPLLEAFKAEVATEPNEHTPPHFRDVSLRSTDGTHLLHTSPSLPDRVRYMSKAERQAVFKGIDGWYYLNAFSQTAVWGLSRLAIETVGFFDENCYPAYFEDTDYLDRLGLIGFQAHYAVPRRSGVLHIGNNMFKTADANAGAPSLGDTLAFLRGTALVVRYLLPQDYIRMKPLMVNMRTDKDLSMALPRLPPDAWMLNERRHATMMEIVRLSILHQNENRTAMPTFVEEGDARFLEFLSYDARTPLLENLVVYENAAEHYRDGAVLRLISIER